jgi:hypothetical protein
MRKKIAQLFILSAVLITAFYMPAPQQSARADCAGCCAGLSPEDYRACMNECKANDPQPVCPRQPPQT